ncbi:UNVERIFIED_CONTAM: hypothetical protein Sradi_5614200 [Sesamum radiatum]|uniref:RNase H type-1 domain-containing protein n=1 Tax=Sesamum radiatum TaxID=300843 RepID=A0AAW2KYI4_SESRA
MTKPDISGRMVKWAMELGKFDLKFQTRMTIKVQAFADFVVEIIGEQQREENQGWLLHVDSSSNVSNGGTWIFLQGPWAIEIEVAVKLSFEVTNNDAEHEALITGLNMALDGGVRQLDAYTDSQMVAMQVEGTYETREWVMIQYLRKVKELMGKFERYQLHRCLERKISKQMHYQSLAQWFQGLRNESSGY